MRMMRKIMRTVMVQEAHNGLAIISGDIDEDSEDYCEGEYEDEYQDECEEEHEGDEDEHEDDEKDDDNSYCKGLEETAAAQASDFQT